MNIVQYHQIPLKWKILNNKYYWNKIQTFVSSLKMFFLSYAYCIRSVLTAKDHKCDSYVRNARVKLNDTNLYFFIYREAESNSRSSPGKPVLHWTWNTRRGTHTLWGRRERGPLDGVGLQTSLEHVVPQFHNSIFTPRHKTLQVITHHYR